MIYLDDKFKKIIRKALRWIFPKKCSVCGRLIPLNKDYCFCSDSESVKISESFCHHCGNDISRCTCKIKYTIKLPEIAAVYYYGGRIRADILDFKFKNQKYLSVKLGTYMAERCANVYYDIDFDVVSFVPMTEKALDVRLYNQSELLAKQVAEMMFLPTCNLFRKIRDTQSQHNLGADERVVNLKNSVMLQENVDVKGKNILICDDIKTTGSTLKECVNVLEENGAGKVCCLCIAISDFSL